MVRFWGGGLATLPELERAEGLEGGQRAVEDRRRWRLEGVAATGGFASEKEEMGGGRRVGAGAIGTRRTMGERKTMGTWCTGPTGCAAPRPHHPGWNIGAPDQHRRLLGTARQTLYIAR
jgi:hypothetical protein